MEKFSEINSAKEIKKDLVSVLEQLIDSKLNITLNDEKYTNEDIKISGKEDLKESIKKLIEITVLKENIKNFEFIKLNTSKIVDQKWINGNLDSMNSLLEKLSE